MIENYLHYINIPVNKILIDRYSELGIDEQSLVVIIRLIDMNTASKSLPDFKTLSEGTTMKENDISGIIQKLMENGLIEVQTVKEEGKYVEHYTLAPLYNKLEKLFGEREANQKNTAAIKELFEYVEGLYGRVISPNEFQRINSWLEDSNHSPEAIKEAVDIAYQNQVTSLQYVERILNSTDNKKDNTQKRSSMPVRSWLEGEDVFD
ncbi:DnaD domain-containing protein [Salinicoccus albus]|uniref:DnaD domain-containing protein n=1 Tax=Salinicoccus albus TaxID=418756 RepID=UPI00036E0F2B|nr:DnaD domain protein [Salinicoccus albus]